MNKFIAIAPRGIIAFFVGCYLVLSAKTHYGQLDSLLFLAIISVLVGVYTYFAPHHLTQFQRESFRVSLGIPLGAITTYYLHAHLGLGTILAAGLVGFAASYLPALFPNIAKAKELPATVYCGAFLGMTDHTIAQDARFIIIASSISMLVFIFTKSYFVKMGGRLGTLAFAGALSTLILAKLWHWLYIS